MPGWAAILLALALCGFLGLVNAVGLTVIGIPSFIMTLAMMQIAAGLRELGKPMPVLHPIQILDRAYGAEPPETAPAAPGTRTQMPSA